MVRQALTDSQVRLAEAFGTSWRAAAVQMQRGEPRGTPHKRNLAKNDIASASAQIAFVTAYGWPWHGGRVLKHPKPTDYHVAGRDGAKLVIYTTPVTSGHLIVKDTWPKDFVAVLVYEVEAAAWDIVGWVRAADASARGTWRSDLRCPAYFVAADDLNDLPPAHPLPDGHCVVCAREIEPDDGYLDLGVHLACLPWQVRNAVR